MSKTSDVSLLNFIAEAGMLKRVRRSGWWILGVKDCETVAEHSFRCAVIAYIIARMEKASSYRALLMALFNDMHEARINDLHKVAQRYIKLSRAEDAAFGEQLALLPGDIKDELSCMHKEYRAQRSRESIIARDADILECLIQAKEYEGNGFREAVRFTKKAPRYLKTKSAKRLWQITKKTDLNGWWERLSEFKR